MKIRPADFIRERFPSQTVRYMPNGGNLGDALIAAATIQALDDAQLSWKFVEEDRGDISNSVLVYGGGGSLIDRYEGGYACVRHLHQRGTKVVVFPQTVRGREVFWRDAPSTIVFCRDMTSFDYMKSFSQHEVYLADDMATNLRVDADPYASVVAYRKHLEHSGLFGREVVKAFRIDDESKTRDASEIDYSNFAHPRMDSRENIVSHAVFFLTMIANAKMVHTDRLHVAVACGLLNIRCDITDNNYGKLRGVYENTLSGKFASLSFKASV